MLPIADYSHWRMNNKRPYVVWIIVGICALVYIYQLLFVKDDSFIVNFGMIPGRIMNMPYPIDFPSMAITTPAWVTLITSIFLHGGFTHILFNMLYLWIFGDNIEQSYGWLGFLVFYIAGGVIANLTHLAFSLDEFSAFIPTIGASGAIAAVMGSYLALYPTSKIRTLVFFFFITFTEIPAYIYLVIWLLLQVFGVFGGDFGTAWWAHIGGFVFGYIVGFLYLKIFKPYAPPPWRPIQNTFKNPFKKNNFQDGRDELENDIWKR